MNETTIRTIKESEVPDDGPRFPQQGSEHPREYREFYVEAELFEPARGRAVSEEQAIDGYRALWDIDPSDAEDFIVLEIIEG